VENECQDIVERSAPYETREETNNKSIRATDIEALITLGAFTPTNWRKMMVINMD
jgi:hypothetical protein